MIPMPFQKDIENPKVIAKECKIYRQRSIW